MPNCSRGPGLPPRTPACMAQSISKVATCAPCSNGRCPESRLMDTLDPASPAATIASVPHKPRIWGFWGTSLWGIFIFAALCGGQIAVLAYFLVGTGGSMDIAAAIRVASQGLTISLSVIMGLPAILLALGLMIFAFCVAAPVSEELLARGFLYRGWSETFVQVPGAIVLSSLVWTTMHMQYERYFFGEIFSLGLWFGYLRYRGGSTWLTIVLHGLNNFGAFLQGLWLSGQS